MRSPDSARRRRSGALLSFAVAFAATLAVLFFVRGPILRSIGHAMVLEDPLPARADAIVVTVDAGAAGLLDASDLAHKGVSRQVAVFAQPADAVDRELARRGVGQGNGDAVWKLHLLDALGVHADAIETPVNGTQSEGDVLPRWCDEHRYESIVLVTAPDHSRRIRREMTRTMKGHATVAVRPARYASFNPDVWWLSRTSLRAGIVEAQKLLLEFVTHPFG